MIKKYSKNSSDIWTNKGKNMLKNESYMKNIYKRVVLMLLIIPG